MEKIRKIHWRTGINRIKKSNVWLAAGINLVFLLSILLFCDIKYETSDDFLMASIMSGAFGGEPNPHMIFINIIWGYILLPFYYLNSHISWYLIAQILLCFASCTIFSYMLLEKSDKKPAVLLIVLLLTFFADDVYVLVQFTKTAVLAVMAGGAVFMWALAENKTKKLKIFSALLCLLGTMVRFNTIFLAGGFLTILIISETLIFFKDKHNNWKKRLLGFFLPGLLLIGAAVGIRQIDQAIYNSDEEYKYFREYNAARAAIVDASDYGYEAYREELEKIGISENDYLLLRSWNFADNEVFSLEVMEKAAQIISDYKENVEISKEAILEGMQERSVTIAGVTHPLARPFFVLATQNPIEQEGTYPLPEAQLDRFMFGLEIDYPSCEDELKIMLNTTSAGALPPLEKIITAEELLLFQEAIRFLPIPESVAQFATRIVRATRPEKEKSSSTASKYIRWGAGPRAGQWLLFHRQYRGRLCQLLSGRGTNGGGEKIGTRHQAIARRGLKALWGGNRDLERPLRQVARGILRSGCGTSPPYPRAHESQGGERPL